MKVLSYRIYLEQPLLATQLLGDPNSSVSFPYIPGSQVRGLLIHRYIERRKLSQADVAGDADCRRLFFNGMTRYLHAYPLAESQQRSLPTPRALLRRKSHELGTAYNASHAEWDDEQRQIAEHDDTLKAIGQPFCVIDDDRISLHQPRPNQIAVHVFRDRVKGRATAGRGTVFRYEALAAGQWFSGCILVDQDADAATIRELLQPDIAWLGRSRSAGYGKVRIVAEGERMGEWREIDGSYPAIAAHQYATLTLLSDTILRDRHGQPVDSLAQQLVAREPTVEEPRLLLDDQILSAYLGIHVLIDATHSFSAVTQHGGFNRTWQLPLPQTHALKAGSVIVFQPQTALDTTLVRRLEQRGIGERRAEGFGRVAFDWLREMAYQMLEGSPYTLSDHAPQLSPTAATLAQRMARQLLEARIEQEIIRFVRDEVIEAEHGNLAKRMPQNSQLARVRVLTRRAVRQQYDPAIVRQGLGQFRQVSKQQFEQARLQERSLWNWLNDLLTELPEAERQHGQRGIEYVWELLRLPETQWPEVAGQRAAHAPALTREVALRLIDAVLSAVVRRRKEASR